MKVLFMNERECKNIRKTSLRQYVKVSLMLIRAKNCQRSSSRSQIMQINDSALLFSLRKLLSKNFHRVARFQVTKITNLHLCFSII
jgi:hypothetical protein